MEGKVLARIAAIVFIAIAITVAAVEMARKEDAPVAPAPALLQPPTDPLREGQRRCQQMGEAAADNPECLAIWAETRDRFLGRTPAPSAQSLEREAR